MTKTTYSINPIPSPPDEEDEWYILICDTGNPEKMPMKTLHTKETLQVLQKCLDDFFDLENDAYIRSFVDRQNLEEGFNKQAHS